MTPRRVQVEVCVETARGALAASEAGAERLELCAGLALGGLTPSPGMIALVRETVSLPIQVLIRPRPGDFLYDRDEVAGMLADIAMAASLGAHGVVIGVLRADGDVDVAQTRTLVEAARPLAITFHRAFDLARDPDRSLEALTGLGIDRVLTSGQAASAETGIPLLRRMVERAGDRIVVMAGGGVTPANASRIVRETGVRELHLSARSRRESPMEFRREGVHLGGPGTTSEHERVDTDPDVVRGVLAALSS